MDSWDNAEHDSLEVCKTVGSLKIVVGPRSLTRNEDGWSQTVKQTTRVSAYPLALWLAASWWRLRWEPLPTGRQAPTSWRMAHELSASGYGFLWPQIVFACDGKNMQLWSVPTRSESEQPVHYLADRREGVPIESFVEAVDNFIDFVLDRLDGVGCVAPDLRNLWKEIQAEREDAEIAEYRRIEAMLGFDPDDLSSNVVERFADLGGKIGSSVLGEIVSVCSSPNPITQLSRINEVAEMQGISGNFSLPEIVTAENDSVYQPPWVRGQQLAHAVRGAVGMNGEAISDRDLSGLAEIPEEQAINAPPSTERLPVGIAIRQESGNLKFVFRKRNRAGRRFELARLLCDHLLSAPTDRWLPATDTKTIRQKWQRAFAAEFLCPINSLVARLGDDFSDDAVEEAADHFGVSERTITSQLVNHGYLTESVLEGRTMAGGFPYLI